VVYRADQDTNAVLELFVRPMAGSGSAVKVNGPLVAGGNVSAYAISRDSTYIVYLADQEHDQLTELYGYRLGEKHFAGWQVNGTNAADVVLDFKISPDSQRVVYRGVGLKRKVLDLYSRTFSTLDPATILNSPSSTGVFAYEISPDGRQVVYISDDDKPAR